MKARLWQCPAGKDMFRLVYLCLQMDPALRPKGALLELEVRRCCVAKGPETEDELTQRGIFQA
jgi:hypothetical protein